MIITHSSVIARVLSSEEEREFKKKQSFDFENGEDDEDSDVVYERYDPPGGYGEGPVI